MSAAREPAIRAHFARLAPKYDRLRTPGPQPTTLTYALVEHGDLHGRHVLDVGCGTGRTLQHLADHFGVRGCGVDSSPEMLAVAREVVPDGVELVQAEAEALPFEDGTFERAIAQLVVHHLDRARAFAEASRVLEPRGRLTVVTADPDAFPSFWMAPLFPSYVDVERARFPAAAALRVELERGGFHDVRVRRHEIPRSFSRDVALDKLRSRSSSTFELLTDAEYEAGLERARHVLADQVEYTLSLLLISGERASSA